MSQQMAYNWPSPYQAKCKYFSTTDASVLNLCPDGTLHVRHKLKIEEEDISPKLSKNEQGNKHTTDFYLLN